MSFFKDFKDDFSQAVNELMPGEDITNEELEDDSDLVVNTLEDELDVESELSKLGGLLEKVTKDVKEPKAVTEEAPISAAETVPEEELTEQEEETVPMEEAAPAEETVSVEEPAEAAAEETEAEAPVEEVPAEPIVEEEKVIAPVIQTVENNKVEENNNMSEATNEVTNELENEMVTEFEQEVNTDDLPVPGKEVSDEVAVITEGTTIKGNMESTGSLDIRGAIDGNVACNGKLVVTGMINGNSTSSEFFADAAKIEGEVVSTGTVKVGLGSVIIGNISATSAVIAGAIKGDIDVQGPVVVDTSAVIMGNIKSRSVQINNGAVIEGFCSQCYAEIDVESLFGEKKVK